MRIEESAVHQGATHALASTRRIEATTSFRSVLREMEAAPATEAPEDPQRKALRMQTLLQELLAAMLAVLTGEKCRCGMDGIAAAQEAEAAPASSLRVRVFEWEKTTVEQIDEHEQTDFRTSGKVRTADGREIDFGLSLSMQRDFSCIRVQQERGKIELCDPLVINFGGKSAELTNARFSFDLDADGSAESLPVLAKGCGYLVLDGDRDGRIADGREVLGALTGEAFADLAALDGDRNGWVDEADPSYAALGVWFPDGTLRSLKEAGIGALNVDSAWSPFALRDADNNPRGQIWRSGVYLSEDGRAGSLQQIDLVKDDS